MQAATAPSQPTDRLICAVSANLRSADVMLMAATIGQMNKKYDNEHYVQNLLPDKGAGMFGNGQDPRL
jgi:hypothetical protein